MDSDSEKRHSPKELESLLKGEAMSVQLTTAEERERRNSLQEIKILFKNTNGDSSEMVQEVNPSSVKADNVISVRFWKDHYVDFYKPLLLLRLTYIFWYGGGRLNIHYFSLLMKQRGLTLDEYYSINSFTFVFQFAGSAISGIVADKLGNAKPVLIFNIFVFLAVMVGILLFPSIDKTCEQRLANVTCCDVLTENSTDEMCPCTNFQDNKKIIQKESEETFDGNTYKSHVITSDEDRTSYAANSSNDNCKDIGNCSEENQSPNNCSEASRNGSRALYAIITYLFFTFRNSVHCLLDFTCFCVAEENNSHVGKEIIFAIIGEVIMSLITSLILNYSSSTVNYDLPFLISVIVSAIALIFIYFLKSVILPPGEKLLGKSAKLIKDIDVMIFFVIVLVAGSAFAFTLNFNLWFLDSLKPSNLLIGLHSAVSTSYGIPILLASKWLLRVFGSNKIIILGLFAYVVNMYCYSYLYQPWISLIIESTSMFHFYLLWVATLVHSLKIAPEGLGATVNAVARSVHFGLGRSTGTAVGGALISNLGVRTAFRTFANICLGTAILYSIFIWWRHSNSKGKKQERW